MRFLFQRLRNTFELDQSGSQKLQTFCTGHGRRCEKGMNSYFRGHRDRYDCGHFVCHRLQDHKFTHGHYFWPVCRVLNLVPYLQTFSLIPAVLLAVIKAEYDQNFCWYSSVLPWFMVVQSIQELFSIQHPE